MPSVFQNLETSSAATEVAVESIDAKTPALVSGATPVSLPAAQVTTLTPPTTVTVQDGGGSLTVDATALPLPTGAATETTLASIDGKTPTLNGIRPVAIRRDADTIAATDGNPTPLQLNSVGRLKVAAMPGDYTAITGDIVAVAGIVSADVGKASNVVMYCTGTFAGVNCTFEASIDGGTTWFGIQAVRTNANTVELTTGVLGAAPAYAWELSVNAFTHVRVRCTARTSGTQTWRIQPGAYATEPIPAIQTHPVTGSGTFTVAGTVTANDATPTTTRTVTAATTNTAAVKASAGTLYALSVFNSSASPIFVKLYNLAAAPVLSSAIPTLVIPVPAGAMVVHQFGPLGERFATGIAIAVTGAVANTDTTAVAAGINVNTTFI